MTAANLNHAAGRSVRLAAWTGTVPCPVLVPPPAPVLTPSGREAQTSQTRWSASPRVPIHGACPSSVRIVPPGETRRSATTGQASPSPGGRGLAWPAGSPAVHQWGVCTAGPKTGATTSSPCTVASHHASTRSPHQADHSADAIPPATSPAGGPHTPVGYAQATRGHRVADRPIRRGLADQWEGRQAAATTNEAAHA